MSASKRDVKMKWKIIVRFTEKLLSLLLKDNLILFLLQPQESIVSFSSLLISFQMNQGLLLGMYPLYSMGTKSESESSILGKKEERRQKDG